MHAHWCEDILQLQTCNKQVNMIHSVRNTGSVYTTVYDVDLTGHCDGYSNNRLTNITQTLTYAIIDEITGDAVSYFRYTYTQGLFFPFSSQNSNCQSISVVAILDMRTMNYIESVCLIPHEASL